MANETTTTEKTVFSRGGLIFAILIVAAGVAIVAAAMWGFMNIDEVESLETEKVTAFLGAVLIFSGIVAALAGFIYSLAFPVERETKTQGMAGESVADIVKVLPDLLTKTAGLGVALALLGVILLAADALGGDDDANAASAEATQTASASPGGDDAGTPVSGSATETPN